MPLSSVADVILHGWQPEGLSVYESMPHDELMADITSFDLANLKQVLRFSNSDRDREGFSPFNVFMSDLKTCNALKVWIEDKVVVIC